MRYDESSVNENNMSGKLKYVLHYYLQKVFFKAVPTGLIVPIFSYVYSYKLRFTPKILSNKSFNAKCRKSQVCVYLF